MPVLEEKIGKVRAEVQASPADPTAQLQTFQRQLTQLSSEMRILTEQKFLIASKCSKLEGQHSETKARMASLEQKISNELKISVGGLTLSVTDALF